ncbi:Secreted protein [Streptomyces clavuligerus]|uniref:Secreted protein n=1 Tax=Streptomyces clavuligerus TaxID=1901 RepID=E2Q2T8_STRCL|nr:Secreted protein [Streptomyces clavuligerus]
MICLTVRPSSGHVLLGCPAVISFGPSPAPAVCRTALALVVVLLMLATTGWTAVRHSGTPRDPRAAQLAQWRTARVLGRPLPDADGPPARTAAFLASVGPAGRQGLARRFPLVVGNLNGAPAALRYRANRIALGRALGQERARLATAPLSPHGRRLALRRVHRLEALMRPGRQILAFDPAGRGRVAEVLGDLDRAERISVIVPGVDTHLLTFQRTSRRYSAPVGMAESLYAAERAAAPGTRTAVIAWADYTAPVGLGMDSVTGRLAEEGALRLTALADALPRRAGVALFCHSYGSVVCGLAARGLPARVTDIAVAGSPGMRASHVTELGARARVWATRDGDDWIGAVPHLEVGGLGHGEDPVAPEFGARVVSAAGAIGHSGYFEPGTESVVNFAAIGVGAYHGVSCAGADDTCRSDIHGEAAA